MTKVLLKKFISLSIAVIFLFSSLASNVNAAIAGPSNTVNNTFDSAKLFSVIPMSQGKITSLDNKQSDTVVINIQDLHSHSDTQRNISKIIDSIASKYNVTEIYTEGGFGKIDVSWIDAVKDAELKNKIIEQLLSGGELTASEYYAMTSEHPVAVKGLEDKQIHRENINRLADIENNKAKYETIISKTEKEIGILNKLYTNSRNIRFNRTLAKYAAGKMADSKLYRVLEKYVNAINANPERYNNITKITFDNYPNIKFYLSMINEADKIDNKRASAELQSLVGVLKDTLSYGQYKQIIDNTDNFTDSEKVIEFVSAFFKANPEIALQYKNLAKLVAINEYAKLLNPVSLLSEQRLLIEKIKFALSYDNTEAEISFITDFKKYFADYLTNSLTQDDWIYVKENLPLFLSLYAKYAAYNNLKEIEADLAELTEYYDVNTHRNEIFLSNIIDKPVEPAVAGSSNNETAEDILQRAKDVKIVITGGYHSEGLKQLLSQKGVTSLVITPNVTTDVTQARAKYEEIIKEQSRFPKEALAYILLSNTGSVNQQVKVLQAAFSMGLDKTQIQTELIDKTGLTHISIEGDNIVVTNGNNKEKIPLSVSKNVDLESMEKALTNVPGLALDAAGSLFNLQSLQTPFAALNNIEYEILKQISLLLFSAEIYFENGPIKEIEEENFLGKSLNGIPADRYERFLPFMQELLLKKETDNDLFLSAQTKEAEGLFNLLSDENAVLSVESIVQYSAEYRKYFSETHSRFENIAQEANKFDNTNEKNEYIKTEILSLIKEFGGYGRLTTLQSTVIFLLYKKYSLWNEMIELYDNSKDSHFRNSLTMKEFYFVALNKSGNAEKTITWVEANIQEKDRNGEIWAALGKGYLKRFQNDNNPLSLEKSYQSYLAGYKLDYEYYPGINAVYRLLELAELEQDKSKQAKIQAEAKNLARLVYQSTERAGGINSGDYWVMVTMVEAICIGGGYSDPALNKKMNTIAAKALAFVKEDWQISSTLSNLRKLQARISSKEVAAVIKQLEDKEKEIKSGTAVSKELTVEDKRNEITQAFFDFNFHIPINSLTTVKTTFISGNYKFGGGLHEMMLDRIDIESAQKVIELLGLSETEDFDQFNDVINRLIREQYGTDRNDLEDLHSKGHLRFDDLIKGLKEITSSSKDADSRTNIIVDFLLGVGDCRQHGEVKQVFYDVWKQIQIKKHYDTAYDALSKNDVDLYNSHLKAINKYERTQMFITEGLVQGQVQMSGMYNHSRNQSGQLKQSSKFEDIEEHVLNSLAEFDDNGNIVNITLVDSFYQHEYKWKKMPVSFFLEEYTKKNSPEQSKRLVLEAGAIETADENGKLSEAKVRITRPNFDYSGIHSRMETGGVNQNNYLDDILSPLLRGVPIQVLLSNIGDLLKISNSKLRKTVDTFLLETLQYYRDVFKNINIKDFTKIVSGLKKLAKEKENGSFNAETLKKYSELSGSAEYKSIENALMSNLDQAIQLAGVFHNYGYYEDIRVNQIENPDSPVIDTRLFDGDFFIRAKELLDCLTDSAKKMITERHSRDPKEKIKLTIFDIQPGKEKHFFELAGKNIDSEPIRKLIDDRLEADKNDDADFKKKVSKNVIANTLQVPWNYLTSDADKYNGTYSGDWRKDVADRKAALVALQTSGIIWTASIVKYALANNLTDAAEISKLIHAGWSISNDWESLAVSPYASLSQEEKRKDWIYAQATIQYLLFDENNDTARNLLKNGNKLYSEAGSDPLVIDENFRSDVERQGFLFDPKDSTVVYSGESGELYRGGNSPVIREFITDIAPRIQHLPLFIMVSPDLSNISYYEIPEGVSIGQFFSDIKKYEPFLSVDPRENNQYLMTPSEFSINKLLAGAKTDRQREQIRSLLDRKNGIYGYRYVHYAADGKNPIITSWDKDIDKGVWATMNDTLHFNKNIEEAGLLNGKHGFRKVLEIGTGGGHLAAMLSRIPGLEDLSYTDISPYALRTAKGSVENNKPKNADFRQHTLLGPGLTSTKEKFDLIVANPPYIPIPEFMRNERENTAYGGTQLIREIIGQAKEKLTDNPNAQIIMTVSSLTTVDLEKYLGEFGADIILEPFGEPLEVPLKISQMNEDWKKYFIENGGISYHADYEAKAIEPYSHTLLAYKIKLKSSGIKSKESNDSKAISLQRIRNLNQVRGDGLKIKEIENTVGKAFNGNRQEINNFYKDFAGQGKVNYQIWHSRLSDMHNVSLEEQIKLLALAIKASNSHYAASKNISIDFRPLIKTIKENNFSSADISTNRLSFNFSDNVVQVDMMPVKDISQKELNSKQNMTVTASESEKVGSVVQYLQSKLDALAEGNNLGVKAEDLENVKNANIGLSLQQLETLYETASYHHQGQVREDGYTPYMAHILGVTSILVKMGITEPELIAAAFLHDSIEDSVDHERVMDGAIIKDVIITPESRNAVKNKIETALLNGGFTEKQVEKIMGYALAMTKGGGKSAYDYYNGLIAQGHSGVVLKLADRIYNMGDLKNNPPTLAVTYLFGQNGKTGTIDEFLRREYGAEEAATTLLNAFDTAKSERVKSMFMTTFLNAVKDNILYTFLPFVKLSLGFFSTVSGKAADTAYVVYATSKDLESKIEKYDSVPGVVFIVNDVVGKDYIGKVNNVPLRTVENKKAKVFSAKGVDHGEILKALQGNRALENVSSFVVSDTNENNKKDIIFEGDIIKVGINLVESRTGAALNDYIVELSKLQRQWRNAQADKNILDIAHLNPDSDGKTIKSVLNNISNQNVYQQARVILNAEQLKVLINQLETDKKKHRTIKDLRFLGIEVFLAVESMNDEDKGRYTNTGISGILLNKADLIDLNTGKKLKSRTFLTKEDLNGKKLNNILSDNYQGYNIIGLNLIKEEINNTRSILQNNNILAAALGWFEKTFSLSEITEQDAVNMAQQLKFSDALTLTGDLTESEAKKAVAKLPEVQIMLGQLTGSAKTAYEKTVTAAVISLNMIERGRAERNIEKGKMTIENDNGMRNTLIALITKAIDLDQNFNGADYLHTVSLEIDTELTFGAIIARALEDLPENATDEQKKKKLEHVKQAIAVVVSDTFNPVFNLTLDKKKEAEKAAQLRLGTRAILAAA